MGDGKADATARKHGVRTRKQESTPAFPGAGGSAVNMATGMPLQSLCRGGPPCPSPLHPLTPGHLVFPRGRVPLQVLFCFTGT